MLGQSNRIEDNEKCKNRYQIRSETSDVIYIIGQEKATGEWVCTCKQFSLFNRDRKSGYRPCKHLQIMQALLPELERKGIIKVLSDSDEKEIDIGYGWKYYERFPPSIKHKEYGYHIIPSDGTISGRLFKQGKHLDAAKHQAYVHTPKDKVSKEQMDEVSKIRKPFGGT